MERPNLKGVIAFKGPEWTSIKNWLNTEREFRVAQLIKAKTWEDSVKHQGAIEIIDKLLFVEKDAERSASN